MRVGINKSCSTVTLQTRTPVGPKDSVNWLLAQTISLTQSTIDLFELTQMEQFKALKKNTNEMFTSIWVQCSVHVSFPSSMRAMKACRERKLKWKGSLAYFHQLLLLCLHCLFSFLCPAKTNLLESYTILSSIFSFSPSHALFKNMWYLETTPTTSSLWQLAILPLVTEFATPFVLWLSWQNPNSQRHSQ